MKKNNCQIHEQVKVEFFLNFLTILKIYCYRKKFSLSIYNRETDSLINRKILECD